MATLDRASAKLKADQDRLDRATTRIAALRVERKRLRDRIDSDTAIKAIADTRVLSLRTRLRHLALQAYVGIDDRSSANAAIILDADDDIGAKSVSTLRRAVTETSHAQYLRQLGISKQAGNRLDHNRKALDLATRELEQFTAQARSSRSAIDDDRVTLRTALEDVRDTRATAIVDGTDLPLVALDAYVHGARLARLRTPGCHLHWSLLAGIGKVESGQGTHGGAALRRDGTLTRPITGIPLDGTQGTETILDADGSFMRAQGPMQFLPSTWARVAVDGDDDQRTDIQNLYDAAASAGAYLCRDGADLSTPQGLRRAILTYNFSGDYVADVTRAMGGYAEALPNVPEPS